MEERDEYGRLPIWEDPDLDFERAERNWEEWTKAAANVSDEELEDYYTRTKAEIDRLVEESFARWREQKGIDHGNAEAET